MDDPGDKPVGWRVELAPEGNVHDHVVLQHGKDVFTLTPHEATSAGVALLAASVVCHSKSRRPRRGTKIENCHFPVKAWSTGRSVANGEPVLLLTIPGGQVLVFQLTDPTSEAVGRALIREKETGRPPIGQKPN
jgi:hypothetical protein